MTERLRRDFDEREEIIIEEEVGDPDRLVTVERHSETERRELHPEEGDRVVARERERLVILNKGTQLVWLLTGILEGLLAIRIFLKLIAANPGAGFANFIYTITYPFLLPFFGLTAEPAANGSVLEIPSIIAMIVYALLAWLLVTLIDFLFDVDSRGRIST